MNVSEARSKVLQNFVETMAYLGSQQGPTADPIEERVGRVAEVFSTAVSLSGMLGSKPKAKGAFSTRRDRFGLIEGVVAVGSPLDVVRLAQRAASEELTELGELPLSHDELLLGSRAYIAA